MKEIKPYELLENPFKLINDDWLLITAKKGDRVNMMTASWGQVGIMWNKPVANIFIRESRFTKSFIDESDSFTLCVLPEKYREQYKICGTKSGRDIDKIKETGLTVEYDNGLPYFKESRLVIECKKLYAQKMSEDCFVDKNIFEKNYPTKDIHTQYIAEITKILNDK